MILVSKKSCQKPRIRSVVITQSFESMPIFIRLLGSAVAYSQQQGSRILVGDLPFDADAQQSTLELNVHCSTLDGGPIKENVSTFLCLFCSKSSSKSTKTQIQKHKVVTSYLLMAARCLRSTLNDAFEFTANGI